MLAEKKNVLKTLKSAILKSYTINNVLEVDIETEEAELKTELDRFYNEVRETVESDYYAFRQAQR